jgi:3-phosphoshikimate 1-carboxyvinyltransferase
MVDYTLPLDQLPDPLPIEPLRKPFDVTITPPGSKSITCRAYVLAALAHGESKIIRPLRADDPDYLLSALCTLGAEARWVKSDTHDGEDVYIKGVGGRFPRGGNLYMGDGGAPTRFMIAAACLAAEPVTIDASPRMRERPIAEGVDILRQLGAKIEYVEVEGRLPVRVLPSKLKGRQLRVGKTSSSQSLSALLLVAPFIRHGIVLNFATWATSASYLKVTWATIGDFDGLSEYDADETIFEGDTGLWDDKPPISIAVTGDPIVGNPFVVEPDASSAIYWFLAAAITKGSRTTVLGLDVWSVQPDALVIHYLKERTTAKIEFECADVGGGYTTVSNIGPVVIEEFCGKEYPDGAVAMAAISAISQSPSKITGLRTLRVKETDRIAALANELRKVGCTVNTGEDWIEITPPTKPSGSKPHAGSDRREDPDRPNTRIQSGSSSLASARSSDPASSPTTNPIIIETYNDHRMAMSFAILGLNPPGGRPLAIRNPACVAKSYPTFWKDFAKLYQ